MTCVVPEQYELLRETVRDLAEAKIAPAAADVDANSRFPAEALDALTGAGLHAAHIPEAHGGEGADALATVIIIEEVARVCASSSLIPAVNKLGTVPLLLAGSEELKRKYLPAVARGEALFSYALSEASAGSDAAGIRTRAVRDGDRWVLNGTKMWISNAGVSQYYTVMAVTDPAKGARGISAFVVEKTDPGVSFGESEKKLGIKGSPPEASSSPTPASPPTGSSVPTARVLARRSPPWTTPGSPSRPRLSASPRAPWTTRSTTSSSGSNSAARSPTSRACSSCSPT